MGAKLRKVKPEKNRIPKNAVKNIF